MKTRPMRLLQQYALPFLAVMAGHVFLLWALVKGLAMAAPQPPEVVVMASIISAPPIEQAPPEPQAEPPKPQPKPVAQPKLKPQPLAIKPKAQAEKPAETVVAQAQPVQATTAAPTESDSNAEATASSAPPSDTVVKPTKADYLNNPKPEYPALSRRLGEEGKVVISVLINTQGRAEEVRLKKSSGYNRLDDAALRAVKTWGFRAGTRNGVAEAMWFDVPVLFRLDE